MTASNVIMHLISYAQNFEDVVLWRALKDIAAGTYLDIGAQHPDEDSVSRLFYERGWRGVHVEANAYYADLLRKHRPDELVIEAMVASADSSPGATFFLVPETGLSTGDADIASGHALAGHKVVSTSVPTITLDAILSGFGGRPVHWMKVDVEGMERAVLEGWGENPARPWVIAIESTLPNSQAENSEDWVDLIQRRDYVDVFFDGLNRYFVHADRHARAESFRAPPNIFDGYAVTARHFTAGLINHEASQALSSHQQQADGRIIEFEAQLADLNNSLELAFQSKQTAEIQARDAHQAMALADARLVNSNARATQQHAELLNHLAIERQSHENIIAAERERATRQQAELLNHLTIERQRHEKIIAAERERATQQQAELLNHLTTERQSHEKIIATERERATQQATELQDLWSKRFDDLISERATLTSTMNGAVEREQIRANAAERQLNKVSSDLFVKKIAFLQMHNHFYPMHQMIIQLRAKSWFKLATRIFDFPDFSTNFEIADEPMLDLGPTSDFETDRHATVAIAPTNMTDLLGLDGQTFVEQAYRSILGREGDQPGVAHYTEQLRSGRSKLFVLWSLRKSDEAANHVPGVAGLDASIRRYKLGNLPVPFVAPLVRLIWPTESEGLQAQAARRIEFRTAAVARSIDRLRSEVLSAVAVPTALSTLSAQTTPPQPNDGVAGSAAVVALTATQPRSGLAGFFQTKIWNG